MHTRESAVKLAEWKEKIEKVEREKEGLGLEIVGLEKRNGELEKEIGRLLADVSGLEKEREENEMRFEAKIRESALELDGLRGRMGVIVREKDAIEQTNANQEAEIVELKREVTKLNLSLSELKELEKRNGELEGEISRLLGRVNGLEKEKEEVEMRYEATIRDSTLELDDLRARMGVIEQEKDAIEEAKANREAEVLELKKEVTKLNLNLRVLQELEKRNGELGGEIGRLLLIVSGLEKEKEENEMRYEAKIRDSTLESDDLRARMGVIEQEKDAIEEAKASREAEVLELKKEVTKLNLNLPVLQELEKRNGELGGEIRRLLLIVSSLEKEKEEKETRFETMVRESASELDDLKGRMGAIVLQKDAMERAKTDREVEILELKKEATKLNSSLLQLQGLSREYREKNAQLQADRDAARRELDAQREEAGSLKLQLDKLTESRDGTLQEFSSLLSEKEEGKRSIKLLSEQKNSLEKSLLVAQANCRDMEGKVAVAEATSAKALSLLKVTVEAVNGSEKTRENGAIDDDDDDENDERILRPFAGELETIKAAHNSRVAKMEEMNRELEAVKSALEEAGKKKAAGLWRWLYPATTTFIAAVSFAYAAKAR
ncbi:uveal autoantigen with coiled-coil domains and ankyrin repeats-like [Iris pallida]|uniref:Uveal autoantigen with coiled-coil domains and ankyrin repeats-like n=1 Tax=Iris pallida TaxID=29817 RepID=A0AAX6IPV4_IRIPA|nr:uveal autoantigen with coiled-coil domains and ankyrin repeats-like [Iris pallida]